MRFRTFIEAFENQAKLKMFGSDAQRVLATELPMVHQELYQILGHDFGKMELTKALPSKQDHGDIDIIVHSPSADIKTLLTQKLGNRILRYSRNGNVYSILFNSNAVRKPVHVDFILGKPEDYATKMDYYSYGDLSAILGLIAKKLNFKYGTEGFFKRYEDKSGRWHDIFITHSLRDGLRMLGYPSPNFDHIKDHDDILRFATSSPMVDSSFFKMEEAPAADRQSARRRTGFKYVVDQIRAMNLVSKIKDPDYYFKTLFPQLYQKVEAEKSALEKTSVAKSSKYNGSWLMQTLNIPPGPKIGQVLAQLRAKWGEHLDEAPERDVIEFVRTII